MSNTYDTSAYPLGSTAVKVLYNNASNVDDFVNGQQLAYPDRFNVGRMSWAGMEAGFQTSIAGWQTSFNQFLSSSGYETPVDYAAGILVQRPTQILRYLGELYRAKDTALPFTTTVWATDSAKLIATGDSVLRQQLAAGTGFLVDSSVIGYNGGSLSVAFGKTIRPEQYGAPGAVGVGNAVADTAAWVACAVALVDGGTVRAEGTYLINGSSVIFPSRRNCTLDLRGAKFTQQTNFSKTLRINTPLGQWNIIGGEFVGRGGAAGEYNGASSSYNGVAAIYVDDGDAVTFRGQVGTQHAGGFIACFGVKTLKFYDIDDTGIGAPYIDPVGHGDQGNGSDFSIMCQPKDNSLGWIYDYTFSNCKLRQHAFGVQAVQTRSCRWEDMEVGPCPGQHGLYGIELDGLTVSGTNRFIECFQFGMKNQYENYSGFYIGAIWTPSTSYAVGDVVRAFSNSYICAIAHVSPASFVQSPNWTVNPLTYRTGTNIGGALEFIRCGYGLGFVSSSLSDGREIYTKGAKIDGIKFTNTVHAAMNLDRLVDADISNITIDGCEYGIFGRDFSGTIRDTNIKTASKNGVAISLYDTTFLDNVRTFNCGLSGSGDDGKAPILIYAPDPATMIPSRPAARAVFSNRLGFIFPTADAAGSFQLFDADTTNTWNIENSYGTTTTKKFRIDGTVNVQFHNYFSPNGFFNTAQNEPTFNLSNWTTNFNFDANGVVTDQMDVIATLMSILGSKNVIRKTG